MNYNENLNNPAFDNEPDLQYCDKCKRNIELCACKEIQQLANVIRNITDKTKFIVAQNQRNKWLASIILSDENVNHITTNFDNLQPLLVEITDYTQNELVKLAIDTMFVNCTLYTLDLSKWL